VIFSLEKLGIMKITSDNDKATKTASQTWSSGPLGNFWIINYSFAVIHGRYWIIWWLQFL